MLKSENFTQYHSTHLTTHLREEEQFDGLFMLVNNDWIDAQFVFSLSHQAVLKDFGIAFDVVSTNRDYFNELPKIALLHSIVSYMSHSVPIKAIEALALMGELDQAQAWSNLLNFVIPFMIVIGVVSSNGFLQMPGERVIVQLHHILHREMVAFKLPLSHRMVWSRANVLDMVPIEIVS